MKWIITGGAGFIGCHAAARFLRLGHDVVVVDNCSRHGAIQNLEWLCSIGGVQFHRVDIRDRTAIESVMHEHEDVDAVLHLAAQVAVTDSVGDPRTDFETNALGTFNLLECARRFARNQPAFLYSSTNKVYGCLRDIAVLSEGRRYALRDYPRGIDEHCPLDFHSPYGCSKGAGDQYVLDYCRIYGINGVSFRQSCIYGTRQFGVEDQGWIAWFCIAVLTGQPLTIYGDGKQVRDALWIDDLVDLYCLAYDNIERIAGRAYNIGGGPENSLSLLELIDLLDELVEGPLDYQFDRERPGDQRIFISNVDKVYGDLGWEPSVGVQEGVERVVNWVKEHLELFPTPADLPPREILSSHAGRD